MSEQFTHYETLEVTETASSEVVRAAFKSLAQKWHPDKHPDNQREAEERMKALNEAIAVLSDPLSRKEYDRILSQRRKDSFHSTDDGLASRRQPVDSNEVPDTAPTAARPANWGGNSNSAEQGRSGAKEPKTDTPGFVGSIILALIVSAAIWLAVGYGFVNEGTLVRPDLGALGEFGAALRIGLAPGITSFFILCFLMLHPIMRRNIGVPLLVVGVVVAFMIADQWSGIQALKKYSSQSVPGNSGYAGERVQPSSAVSEESKSVDDMAGYTASLGFFERTYPQINPDSPLYDEALERQVGAAIERHRTAGASLQHSLRLAIRDVMVPLTENKGAERPTEKPPVTLAEQRYTAKADGTVSDSKLQLIWAGADNGKRVSWYAAQEYCGALGAGWKLPTANQLLYLTDSDGGVRQDCGTQYCWVTPLIKLTGMHYWSSDVDEASNAMFVVLTNDNYYWAEKGALNGQSALCVKEPR